MGNREKQRIVNDVDDVDEEDGGRLMMRAQRSKRLQRFRHYYQHPYFRIFVSYFVTICNFWIYAEDPVAHSKSKCEIPVVGNTFSFVATKYPPNGFSALKVFLWLVAIIAGVVFGKLVIHHILLKRLFKLSMFSNDQGSWLISFLTTVISLLIFSFVYNGFLSLDSDVSAYKITGYIGAANHTFMRAAALGTWFGDFITAWMVTDMMLQDNTKYENWIPKFRAWWKKGLRRVYLFWAFSIILSIIVITAVCTHYINWDKFNRDVIYTNELGRAFLASFILVMDFTIVMQDWDFPLFQTNLDVKLPGLNTAHINFRIPDCLRREHWTITVTGKWFNYGILFFVMLLDLNMWKNQIFYTPLTFGQYTGEDDHIYSVYDEFSLNHYMNTTIYSYAWRNSTINPITNATYISADHRTNSRYRGYALAWRGLAFIPSLIVFIMFGVLIYIFGREGTEQYENAEFKTRGVSLTSVQIRRDRVDKVDGEENEGKAEVSEPTEPTVEKPPQSNNYGATATNEAMTVTKVDVD